MTTWLPVPEWEGLYEVSDDGQVRNARTLRTLTPTLNGPGYKQVNLCSNGARKTRAVHVLVAAAFLGPRPDGLVIRHLDGDELNNNLTNLTYGTASENARDQVRHGTHSKASKTHCKHGHELGPENVSIRVRVRDGRTITERRCLTCRRAWDARPRGRQAA